MSRVLCSYLAAAVLCSAVTACGGDAKKDEKKVEAKAPTKAAEPEKAAAKPEEPVKAPEPAPAAPADPATFVAVDLSAVATLAAYTINGPPGAAVKPDEVEFGKDAPRGVVIEKDGFKLHLWRGTIGGERTTMPMRGQMEGFKYSETKNEGAKGLLEYAIEKGGKTSVG